MEITYLKDAAFFVFGDNEKVRNTDLPNYISTENMLPDIGGVALGGSRPLENSSVKRFKSGDILISKIRPYLRKIWLADIDGLCSNDVLVLRANSQTISEYIYYCLTTDDFFNYATSTTQGTRMPRCNAASLLNYPIRLIADKNLQKDIVAPLVNLDRKIKLNKAINDNLEAMARQLYEYWFVQFEFPDENGRPYKSSGGKMVWSDELNKEIPALWQVGTILDIATYKNGLACQKYPCQLNEVGLPVIKIKEMKQGISSSTQRVSKNVPEYALIESGDILFSWSASIEVSIWTGENGVLNQHIFKVIPKDQYFKSFDYFTLQDCVNVFRTIAEARKTTMGHITQDHLKQMPSIIPDVKVLKGFEGILSPILQLYSSFSKENLTLMHRREQLAADLLSGKVKLALS